MRICPGNPGTHAFCKRLCKETEEIVGIDEFGNCVHPRVNKAEHALGCQDGEETRERCSCNGREEKVSARLQATKTKAGKRAQRQKSHVDEDGIRVSERAASKRTLTSSAHDLSNAVGLPTCSTTSVEETTSNDRTASAPVRASQPTHRLTERQCGDARIRRCVACRHANVLR
jgi:hypothetical protein